MLAVFAACLFEAQATTYNLTVLANTRTQAWNRFYEMGVATDHQNTLITYLLEQRDRQCAEGRP